MIRNRFNGLRLKIYMEGKRKKNKIQSYKTKKNKNIHKQPGLISPHIYDKLEKVKALWK